jgi:hypothetical protein
MPDTSSARHLQDLTAWKASGRIKPGQIPFLDPERAPHSY